MRPSDDRRPADRPDDRRRWCGCQVTKSLSGVLVAEALDPLSAPQPVPYPHDLAAPAARADGHRVRPPGHFAPGDLSARLADELCHRRHLKGVTRPTVEFIGHLRVLYVSRAVGVPGAGERKRGLRADRSCASGFGDRTLSPKGWSASSEEAHEPSKAVEPQSLPTTRSFGRFCSAFKIAACHLPGRSSKVSASSRALVELAPLEVAHPREGRGSRRASRTTGG
jgi:hypothetical protein